MANTCMGTREVKSSRSTSPEPSAKRAKPFRVNDWHAVALWAWDVDLDNCAICRNPTTEVCIECQANLDSAETPECEIAMGACNHAFHFHCISKWLAIRPVCPLDNTEWELSKYSAADDSQKIGQLKSST